MSIVESLHTPVAATSTPDSAVPPGLSRRTFLAMTAAASGGLAVALTVGVSTPATAAPAPSGSLVRSAPVPNLAVADLPVVYGTPTDIARIRTGWWWSRDTDGTVLVFDRSRGRWRATAQQDWAGLVAAGSPILARWGRPSGRRELMLVSGPDPDSGSIPPTTSDPTPPSSPDPSSPDPTTPSPSSTPTTTSSAAASIPSSGTTTVTPTPPPSRAVPGAAAQASGALPNTGYDPTTTVGLALAALAAGGGLLVVARERGRRDPARRVARTEQEPTPPSE